MIRRITDYLEISAKRFPEKTAFADQDRKTSFSEFRREALSVAQTLIDERLFRQSVIIYMEKCVACVACFYGSAYSGNYYTLIDVEMPTARVEKIAQTMGSGVVITNKNNSENAVLLFPYCKIFVVEELVNRVPDEAAVLDISKKVIDTDILYVLFTSGSTGVPKGVIISHRAAIDYTEWVCEKFEIDETHNLGSQVPLYFDFSIQDVFIPVKTGASTHLIPPVYFGFPGKLMDYLCEREVNTIFWVPTALCIIAGMGALELDMIPDLKKIFFAGEVMPVKQLKKWRSAYPDALFANLFGPTEICNICAWYILDREFEDDETIPMGWPCENTDIILLTEDNKPVENDEIGEICVRGTCLAFGYYNNPEKTREVFTQNPLNDAYDELIYHTGDLARYNEYGEMVYIGRKDFQIKRNGYRIELGEIEAVVSKVDKIERDCCIYDPEHSLIVLYYSGDAEEEEVAAQSRQVLPDYMVPDMCIRLKEMPINLNGKIDRVRLQEMLKQR